MAAESLDVLVPCLCSLLVERPFSESLGKKLPTITNELRSVFALLDGRTDPLDRCQEGLHSRWLWRRGLPKEAPVFSKDALEKSFLFIFGELLEVA